MGQTASCSSATKGMLLSDYGKHVLLPEKEFKDFKRPEPTHPASRSATTPSGSTPARPATPTTCNFEYAGWLTEANHLGNVAYRAGKKLEWDPAKMQAAERPRGRPVHQAGVPQGVGAVGGERNERPPGRTADGGR